MCEGTAGKEKKGSWSKVERRRRRMGKSREKKVKFMSEVQKWETKQNVVIGKTSDEPLRLKQHSYTS